MDGSAASAAAHSLGVAALLGIEVDMVRRSNENLRAVRANTIAKTTRRFALSLWNRASTVVYFLAARKWIYL